MWTSSAKVHLHQGDLVPKRSYIQLRSQGLSSYHPVSSLAPGGGTIREPGNEVGLHRCAHHCRNVRGQGKSMLVFRLFEKLRCSNERSTKFENLYHE